MTTKTKKIIKITVDVVLWVFLAFALVMTVFAFLTQADGSGIPKFGKKCALTVLTPSMVGPEGFNPGDLIISNTLTEEEKQNLQKGDVITFLADLDGDGSNELNTHRIYEVTTDVNGDRLYYTKGDNNELRDNKPVEWFKVEAKWTGKRVPGLGKAINFLQSSTGFLVCIVLPLLAFLIYEIYVLILTVMKIRNKGKKQITEADEELIKQRAIEEYLRQQAAIQAQNQGEKTPDATAEATEATTTPTDQN